MKDREKESGEERASQRRDQTAGTSRDLLSNMLMQSTGGRGKNVVEERMKEEKQDHKKGMEKKKIRCTEGNSCMLCVHMYRFWLFG